MVKGEEYKSNSNPIFCNCFFGDGLKLCTLSIYINNQVAIRTKSFRADYDFLVKVNSLICRGRKLSRENQKIGKMERNSNGGSPKIIKTRSHMYVGCCPGKNF